MKTISEEYSKLQEELHKNPYYGVASTHFAPVLSEIIKGFSDRFNETQFEAIDTLKSFGAKIIDQVVKDYILSW